MQRSYSPRFCPHLEIFKLFGSHASPKPTRAKEQALVSIPFNSYSQFQERVNNSFYLCSYNKVENEADLF